MTKTITLYEANAPSNPKATLSGVLGGGSGLTPNTTFYYRIVGVGYRDYYYDTAYQMWLSKPSIEISVTIDATHKTVFLEVDKLQDTTGVNEVEAFIVYRTTTQGDYKQTNSSGVPQKHCIACESTDTNTWIRLNVQSRTQYRRYTISLSVAPSYVVGETITGNTSGATGIVTSINGTTANIYNLSGIFQTGETITGSVSGLNSGTVSSFSAHNGYIMVDNRTTTTSYQYTQPLFENGIPNFVYDGYSETDRMTPQLVYEYFQSIGKPEYFDGIQIFENNDIKTSRGYNLCNMFVARCNIQDKGGDNYWYQEGGTALAFAGGKIALKGHSERGEIDSNGVTTNGACEIYNSNYAWYPCLYIGTHKFNASLVCGPTESLKTINSTTDREPLYQWSASTPKITDSVLKSTGRFNCEYEVYNSRIMIAGEGSNPNNTDLTENAVWNCYTTSWYPESEATFKNRIFKNTSSRAIYLDGYYINGGCKMLHYDDVEFANTSYAFLIKGNSTNKPDLLFEQKSSLSIKFVDENYNPIKNVKLSVKDSNGDNALFSNDWVDYAYDSALDKTGTTLTGHKGGLVVGKYYKVGFEIIKIISGTNPYTIARAQLNSTANNIGGAGSPTNKNYLYEVLDNMESDLNGNIILNLRYRYYAKYEYASSSTSYVAWSDLITVGYYDITITKNGYETIKIKYFPNKKREIVLQLTPVKSYNQHKTITIK